MCMNAAAANTHINTIENGLWTPKGNLTVVDEDFMLLKVPKREVKCVYNSVQYVSADDFSPIVVMTVIFRGT